MLYEIPYAADNLAYVAKIGDDVLLVDAGNFMQIDAQLMELGLVPNYLLLTHHHADHTCDANLFKEKYNLKIIGNMHDDEIDNLDIGLKEGKNNTVPFDLEMIETKGHTNHSAVFILHDSQAIFFGDVLFHLGCGRNFTGNHDWFFASLQKIAQIDLDYYFCCGHDYLHHNLDFVNNYFSGDEEIASYPMKKPGVITKFLAEKKANPFLRFSQEELWNRINAKNEANFSSNLRKLRNEF